jgi:hypothetical protein
MRKFIRVLPAILVLFPALAWAQDSKPIPLAQYVSFCLALWDHAPDVQSKATLLGLWNVTPGGSMTAGKTTIRFYRSTQGNQTVAAASTNFADGKDSSCDINLPIPTEQVDMQAMEQALDLDGQIVTGGPVTLGFWKMRNRQPPVLLKASTGKVTILRMHKFDAALAGPTPKQSR